jgi:hypothetical protein
MIQISLSRPGLYAASLSPPHGNGSWHTEEPLSFEVLLDTLLKMGCHPTDVADAFIDADPETRHRFGINEAPT